MSEIYSQLEDLKVKILLKWNVTSGVLGFWVWIELKKLYYYTIKKNNLQLNLKPSVPLRYSTGPWLLDVLLNVAMAVYQSHKMLATIVFS